MRLELRNLWGADPPLAWQLDGDDEETAKRLLARIDSNYEAAPERRSAVLHATEDDGRHIGSWNRDGARQFVAQLDVDGLPSEGWRGIRTAILNGVEGP